MIRFVRSFITIAIVVLVPTVAAAQTTGIITGRVTDAESGQPVPAAQVNIVGTTLGRISDADGRYAITAVSPGNVQVRVLRVGYAEQKQPATVVAGQTTTVDFALNAVSIQLAPVVTTATGEQRRLEVGNTIPEIRADSLVATRPIANVSDLLTARAPGVQVLPGNMTGTGARVRIRGSNSLSLSNDPIYIIDGIRMEAASGSSSISIGGSTPSRLSDINPEEIESIEVVKGPSAATLYGTDAASGVIVIRTKRGRVGAPQWSMYAEQGAITDRNEYPVAYTNVGRLQPSGNATSSCFVSRIAAGTCRSDSLRRFNLFEDDETTPLGTGRRQQYGLQVRGGSELVRYFASGEWEDEVGVLKIPEFDMRRLSARNFSILDEWERPNAKRRWSTRANIDLMISQKLDFGLRTGYTTSKQRLPQTDNNTTGLLSSAYGGPGFKYNTGLFSSLGDTLYGYRVYTPGEMFQETNEQEINRFIGGLNASWRPKSWLSTRGNFGVDFTSRVDSDLCRFGTCVNFGTNRDGFRENNRARFFQYTVDVSGTASFQPLTTLTSKTTVGVQYFNENFERNGARGEVLPPGSTSITAGAIQFADERGDPARTLGAFIEQNVGWRDLLFVTGALRMDDNSAFGADFDAVVYPKFSLSWIASDEAFFPKPAWLDLLRVRTAVGASGRRPGTADAQRYFTGNLVRTDDAEIPGFTLSALGNRALKPEWTQEIEAGADATFLRGRFSVELTYYNKSSRDALVQRILPASLGTDSTWRFENLGKVRNWGWEGLVSAQVFDSPSFGWDVSLSGSTNSNELVDLGDVPPIIGNTISQKEGYPLNGYWHRRITGYADADGDGMIDVSEVTVSDTAEFLGYSIPRRELVLNTGIDFLNKRVRLAALFDHKGGHKLYNNTERIRCQSRNNCVGLMDPSAPLFEQARVIALRDHPSRSVEGYIEDASFTRFRELSLSFTAPEVWASRLFRSNRAILTLSARNLKTWTDYTGLDPESNYNTLTDVPADFQTTPPPTVFMARLSVDF
jgi:TonB-linked SusC/RagA family outer membrane protein